MLLAMTIGLFSPLIGFLILTASANRVDRKTAGIFACFTILVSFLVFSGFLVADWQNGLLPKTIALFQWIPVQGINADFTLHLDSLSLLMTLIITGVGFLIHVYSIGYMDHEEDYSRFFACLNFFVFAMLLLVLAGHLLVLFLGWEGVGLASYLLIGFWYEKPTAAAAATKAFVMNRIGDFGLLIGLLLTFYLFGTGDITDISALVGNPDFSLGAPIITLLTLLYFVGAVGKSAQLPLHTWLPDAMEGPTPVSALIHAATMVTAGVYLVVRMHPVFILSPDALLVVGSIGAATSLFAALCAIGQTDLKRVLAYSTVSQLGFMFLACGVGAFYAAMFHLTMHAFIKALLFLSAGNVVHMMHGETEMDKMGGLRKIFTKTHWLFLIGVLAMAGIPPLAAFFSKELILEQGFHAGFKTLYGIGLFTSLLTAFYLMRAYCLTFTNELKENEHLSNIKEAPNVMLIPVSVLAFLSIFGGFIGYTFGTPAPLERFLARSDVALPHTGGNLFLDPLTWLAIFGSILGLSCALFLYFRVSHSLGAPIQFLKKAFYVDQIYEALIVHPMKWVSRFIIKVLEAGLFDGMLRFIARGAKTIASALQHIQSGQIRSYVAWMMIGSVFLIVYLVF
jgi:NADH-quinone oxidoreductase subunit L